MNQKVEEFLAKAKENLLAQEQKKKDEILISLGLFEEEKIYSDKQVDITYRYDYSEGKYCKTTKKPVEVTDKEYAEILKYSMAEEKKGETKDESNNAPENTLNTIAAIVLIFGLVATIVCACTLMVVEGFRPGFTYVTEKSFSPEGFATTVTVLLGTLATWSIMKVIANISLNVKAIKEKCKS